MPVSTTGCTVPRTFKPWFGLGSQFCVSTIAEALGIDQSTCAVIPVIRMRDTPIFVLFKFATQRAVKQTEWQQRAISRRLASVKGPDRSSSNNHIYADLTPTRIENVFAGGEGSLSEKRIAFFRRFAETRAHTPQGGLLTHPEMETLGVRLRAKRPAKVCSL